MLPCLAKCQKAPSIDSTFGLLQLNKDIYCSNNAAPVGGFVVGENCCYPMSTAEIDLKFFLFVPNAAANMSLQFNDTTAKEIFSRYENVIYIIHGFRASPKSKWIILARKYWNNKNVPVIVIDYAKGVDGLRVQGNANVRTVGMAVGYSIVSWGIANRTLLVGHSLGAQVIGQAGYYVNSMNGPKIKECHGLDPAGGYFDGGPRQAVLDKSDCEVVQVIHTSAQLFQKSPLLSIALLQLGTGLKSGHCDYWINCGRAQPETCFTTLFRKPNNIDLLDILLDIFLCSHSRAYLIYVNQLYGECNYKSYKCVGCGDASRKCSIETRDVQNGIPPNSHCSEDMDVDYVAFTTNQYCFSYPLSSQQHPIFKQLM